MPEFKKKCIVQDFNLCKKNGTHFAMVTVYDYPFARLVDESPIEMILVGDSLGMVIQGLDTTIPVTLEEMVYHIRIVRKGAPHTFVVGDMPYMSYQPGIEEAVKNAGRLMQAGADCIKLEGGTHMADRIEALVKAGIPVMGHIGLTPQSASALGGFKVQGKDTETAKRLLNDAASVDSAGAFSMVVECVPAPLMKEIDTSVRCATISVGGGPCATGQNINAYDLLGIFDKFVPKFVKVYKNMSGEIIDAFTQFSTDIASGVYPAQEHCFGIKSEEEYKALIS